MNRSSIILAATLALALGACGVSSPDETPWQKPAAYVWPAENGAAFRYRVEKMPYGRLLDTSITDVTVGRSDSLYAGVQMYELQDPALSRRFWLRYASVGDTVIARNEPFQADLLLVGPLDRGKSWTCGHQTLFNGSTTDTIPWRATVLDRYSWKKVEGRVYQNVIEVEYRPEVSPTQESWVRLYAEGIGPIQTVKNYSPQVDSTVAPILTPVERTVLVETSVAE